MVDVGPVERGRVLTAFQALELHASPFEGLFVLASASERLLLKHFHEELKPWDGRAGVAGAHEARARSASQAAHEAKQEEHLNVSEP